MNRRTKRKHSDVRVVSIALVFVGFIGALVSGLLTVAKNAPVEPGYCGENFITYMDSEALPGVGSVYEVPHDGDYDKMGNPTYYLPGGVAEPFTIPPVSSGLPFFNNVPAAPSKVFPGDRLMSVVVPDPVPLLGGYFPQVGGYCSPVVHKVPVSSTFWLVLLGFMVLVFIKRN